MSYNRIELMLRKELTLTKKSALKECHICHYWYFKDIDFKYESYVCNGCHDISPMVYELKNIVILNVKGVGYRCVLWNMIKNDSINRLNNSKLDDRGTL